MHVGAFIGPSIYTGNPPAKGASSTFISGGFDAAVGLIPTLEVGAFYTRTLSDYSTMIGAEAHFYPLISHFLYFGGKLGNANMVNDNHIVYAPVAGFNYDLMPAITIGVDADYFIFNNLGLRDIELLGNIKLWL